MTTKVLDFDMHPDSVHTHLRSGLGSQQYTQILDNLNCEHKHTEIPNHLAQRKINQQLNHTQYTRIQCPRSLVLKPRTMGSSTRDNGPILHKRTISKHLQNTVETLLVSVSKSAVLRLRVRASLTSPNSPLPLQSLHKSGRVLPALSTILS